MDGDDEEKGKIAPRQYLERKKKGMVNEKLEIEMRTAISKTHTRKENWVSYTYRIMSWNSRQLLLYCRRCRRRRCGRRMIININNRPQIIVSHYAPIRRLSIIDVDIAERVRSTGAHDDPAVPREDECRIIIIDIVIGDQGRRRPSSSSIIIIRRREEFVTCMRRGADVGNSHIFAVGQQARNERGRIGRIRGRGAAIVVVSTSGMMRRRTSRRRWRGVAAITAALSRHRPPPTPRNDVVAIVVIRVRTAIRRGRQEHNDERTMIDRRHCFFRPFLSGPLGGATSLVGRGDKYLKSNIVRCGETSFLFIARPVSVRKIIRSA